MAAVRQRVVNQEIPLVKGQNTSFAARLADATTLRRVSGMRFGEGRALEPVPSWALISLSSPAFGILQFADIWPSEGTLVGYAPRGVGAAGRSASVMLKFSRLTGFWNHHTTNAHSEASVLSQAQAVTGWISVEGAPASAAALGTTYCVCAPQVLDGIVRTVATVYESDSNRALLSVVIAGTSTLQPAQNPIVLADVVGGVYVVLSQQGSTQINRFILNPTAAPGLSTSTSTALYTPGSAITTFSASVRNDDLGYMLFVSRAGPIFEKVQVSSTFVTSGIVTLSTLTLFTQIAVCAARGTPSATHKQLVAAAGGTQSFVAWVNETGVVQNSVNNLHVTVTGLSNFSTGEAPFIAVAAGASEDGSGLSVGSVVFSMPLSGVTTLIVCHLTQSLVVASVKTLTNALVLGNGLPFALEQKSALVYTGLYPIVLNHLGVNTESAFAVWNSLGNYLESYEAQMTAAVPRILGSGPTQFSRGACTPAVNPRFREAIIPRYEVNTSQVRQLQVVVYATQAMARQAVEVDGVTLVASGVTLRVDDTDCYEQGLAWRPVLFTLGEGAGGSLTSGGAYSVAAYWSFTDPQGREHRSGPSQTTTIDMAGGSTQLTASWNSAVFRRPVTLLNSFRTVVDPANGQPEIDDAVDGTNAVLYFEQADKFLNGAPQADVVLNLADSAVRNLVTSLTQINTTRVIYTQSRTQIGSSAPVPADFVGYFDNRVALASFRGRRVQFSKPMVSGEPLEFADRASALGENFFQEVQEPITGLGTLDDNLFIFSERSVYILPGSGPDTNGNGSYDAPVRLPTVGGTVHPYATVETPQGLFCLLNTRLSLLPRGGGAPVWVGEPVDAYVRAALTASVAITATTGGFHGPNEPAVMGCLIEHTNEVLWVFRNGASVCANLTTGQWSVDYAQPFQSTGDNGFRLCRFGGSVVALQGDSIRELRTTPNVGPQTCVVELQPIALDGQAGWHELYSVALQGVFRGNCTIRCEFSSDGLTYTSVPNALRDMTSAEFPVGSPFIVQWGPPETFGTALHIRFTMVCEPNSAGCSLQNVRLTGSALSAQYPLGGESEYG